MSSQDPSMSEMLWRRGIEQVVLTSGAKERVLGLFGLRGGTGVSQVALRVARTLASANRKTLLVDARGYGAERPDARAWRPGLGGLQQYVVSTGEGYDRLYLSADLTDPGQGRSIPTLDLPFANDLAGYDSIVVEVPALLDTPADALNPLAVARACDRLLLVCSVGSDRKRELRSAMSTLSSVGVEVAGIIAMEPPAVPQSSIRGRVVDRLRSSALALRARRRGPVSPTASAANTPTES